VPVAIALPDLGLLAAAMIAFALAFGILALANLLATLVHSVPVIGGGLASAIKGAVNYAESQLHTWQENVIGALVGPLAFIWAQLGPAVDAIGVTFDNVYNALDWSVSSLVPAVAGQLWGGIGNAEAAAQALVSAAVGTAAADAASALGTAEHDIAQGVSAATAYAGQVAGAALSQAEADIQGAEALVAAQVSQLAGVVAANQAALESLVTGGLSGVEAQLAQAEATAQQEIGAAVQGVRDWAAQNEQAIQQSLTAAISGGLAGVIAQIGTVAEELTQTKQCADPLCTNLSGFGQALSGLGGYLETGAIFALLAFCIEDPKAAAGAVEDVVGPMAAGLGDGLKAVVGL
jgi:hypothetical protein